MAARILGGGFLDCTGREAAIRTPWGVLEGFEV